MDDEQASNVAVLALGLRGLKDTSHFDMSWYCTLHNVRQQDGIPNGIRKHYAACGSSCCALGHGPVFGVKIPQGTLDWESYSRTTMDLTYEKSESRWFFAFSSEHPSDPVAAAHRLVWLMMNRDSKRPPAAVDGYPVDDEDNRLPEPDWELVRKIAGRDPLPCPT